MKSLKEKKKVTRAKFKLLTHSELWSIVHVLRVRVGWDWLFIHTFASDVLRVSTELINSRQILFNQTHVTFELPPSMQEVWSPTAFAHVQFQVQ